ncbi:MAG: pirin family protein [candidate division WOR-3 bacterium]|nr:MAG: pirin family protein [candidate division WOR-3 bacterium]
MMEQRLEVIRSKPTIEGAGVHLKRAFGFHEVPKFDPFLLLDDFGSDDPRDYILGFPWHPHRGIETVTYMKSGMVKHEDSIGNKGIIRSGDVQWMTAGSGIVHQEMPQQYEGRMRGFQLWVNLPASHKMMPPRYREVKSEQIPEVVLDDGVVVKLISGELGGKRGPVRDIIVDTEYFDVVVPSSKSFKYDIKDGFKTFAYVYDGRALFKPKKMPITAGDVVIFHGIDKVEVNADNETAHVLLVSGRTINEPVAWYGPIVMNTKEELDVAFREYQEGDFIKHQKT